MKRITFVKSLLTVLPGMLLSIKLNAMKQFTELFENTPKMPVLFIGHGSPMNAIEENEFVQGFRKVSSEIKIPKAILVISAHWETAGTKVTAMKKPPTIHDFGGFPQELFDMKYPAPGSPELALETQNLIKSTQVYSDNNRGFDHGTWSILSHMYPRADVPVIQLSIDYKKSPREHYETAKELIKLREKGILIIGSGNIIHNLQMFDWRKFNENVAFDWAQEANRKMNEFILKGDHTSLINFSKQGKAFQLSIPTPEHFIPLLYILALQDNKDNVSLFNDKPVGGSLSMTSVKIA